VWITHDLAVVSSLADDIHVMYAGRIVESGPAAQVLRAPQHHYTQGLLNSVPSLTAPGAELRQIPGTTPSLLRLPAGCAFRTRCPRADALCETMPELTARGTRAARCHHPLGPA
jgi:peptide/nickel transport system ATP-binding protein